MKERNVANVQKTEPDILKIEEEIPRPIEVNVIERVAPKESTIKVSSLNIHLLKRLM